MNAMVLETFQELDPSPRLIMGPGPVDVYPRVLRAMSGRGTLPQGRWRCAARPDLPADDGRLAQCKRPGP